VALSGVAFSVGLLAITSGCGSSLPATVSGKVTYEGKALTSGLVTFYPVGRGPAAVGKIGPDGDYEIRTGRASGLEVGDYTVTVEAFDVSDDLEIEDAIAESILPAQYADRKRTDLEFTVQAGHNQFDLPLTKD
jgi:hypothetical protein